MINKQAAIRWDAHACPPFTTGADLSFLERYKKSGVNFLSLNVGYDLMNQQEVMNVIHYFQQWILENNHKYELVSNVHQLMQCQLNNKLAIAFDIEGCNVLDGQLEKMIDIHSLGVRQMLFAYNKNNLAGGGCLDADISLTSFGWQLVNECNKLGIVIDCSHAGYRTSMDIIDSSEHPIIFSHSNPARLVNHPRNIKDDQIIACAKRDGVIGINGIGMFLGDNDTRTQRIVEHIDYVVQLVGAKHVGIGLDCVFNMDEIKAHMKKNPNVFPAQQGFNDVVIAEPEQFAEISDLLSKKGYAVEDIDNILGENFLRVAELVWK